jgi:hypothetical protein
MMNVEPDSTPPLFANGSRYTAKSAGDDLTTLQQQLLDVAIYAGALRVHMDQPLSPLDRALLVDLLARVETNRKALELHIAAIERLRAPWWRRWRR